MKPNKSKNSIKLLNPTKITISNSKEHSNKKGFVKFRRNLLSGVLILSIFYLIFNVNYYSFRSCSKRALQDLSEYSDAGYPDSQFVSSFYDPPINEGVNKYAVECKDKTYFKMFYDLQNILTFGNLGDFEHGFSGTFGERGYYVFNTNYDYEVPRNFAECAQFYHVSKRDEKNTCSVKFIKDIVLKNKSRYDEDFYNFVQSIDADELKPGVVVGLISDEVVYENYAIKAWAIEKDHHYNNFDIEMFFTTSTK
ncbi:hypothetical protein KKD03_03365 [Patescibacteria group bacterium]|nr:hypothetical protein [Patescibacteria group bacterium]